MQNSPLLSLPSGPGHLEVEILGEAVGWGRQGPMQTQGLPAGHS